MHTWVTLPGPVQLQSMPLQRGTGDRCSRAHRRPTHPTAGESFSTRTSTSCPEIGAGDKRRASAASEALAAHAAAQRGPRGEVVALAPLCSLRPPPAGNGRWIQPAKGFSKRSASAGTHRDKDLEQQRSPDHTPRGARGMGGSKEERSVGQGGAGLARTHEKRAPIEAGRRGTQKVPRPEPKK